jgi:hypothetical protein
MSIKKTIEIEARVGKAEKDLKGLDKGLQKVDKSVEDIGESSKETNKEMGAFGSAMDKVTRGGYSGFTKMTRAIRTGNISLKAMKVALIATGVGIFVAAIGALAANFGNSEKGGNKLNKMLAQIGVVSGNVTDILYSLSQSVVSFFSGNFDEAAKSFEEATNRMKNFGEETRREIALQGELADKQADLVKLERQLVIDRAEANKKRADLLDKSANKEEFTAKQRIAFLEEAGRIDEEITNKEIEAAKTRLLIKEQENTLSESSAEDLAEEARLKAEVINLDTQRLTKAKTVTAQIIAAKREEATRLKGIRDAEAKEIADKEKEQEALNKAEQDAIDAEEKLKAEQAAKAADEAAKTETARQDAIDAIQDAYKLKREDKAAQEAENAEMAKIELEESRALAELDRLDATEAQKADVIAFYANKKQAVKDDEAEKELALDQQVKDAKKKMAMDGLALLGQVAGEGSKVGKAVALTQTIISGIEGVQNAYKTAQDSPITTVFPAYPIIQAGLAAGFAAAQVSAIKKTPATAKGGGGGGGVNVPRSTPSVPSFNVVGAAPENQLAQSLGQQEKEPVKAYVVSNEVTNAQALDRNIVESASLG